MNGWSAVLDGEKVGMRTGKKWRNGEFGLDIKIN